MKTKENSTWEYIINVIFPIILYSGITGLITGVIVSSFNYVAVVLNSESMNIYSAVKAEPKFLPLLFVGLALLAILMNILLSVVKEVKGSGIPRTEGILRGLLRFKWYRLLVFTIAGSFISFFAGLPLGAEGPSIQLGAATASGVSNILKNKYAWRRYIATGGASAGMAVAFKAPITGIVFCLEEVHKQFNPLIMITAMTAVATGLLSSGMIARLWGGTESIFGWATGIVEIPYKLYGSLLFVGVVAGLSAFAFNHLLVKISSNLKIKKIPQLVKLVCVFFLAGLTGLLIADCLGSGMNIIKKLCSTDLSIQIILVMLVIKTITIVFVFDSGATGGLFIPMLTVGALVGGVCGKILIWLGVDPTYYNTFIVLTMAAFLGAGIRAPLTAMVLLVETTGAASGFLSVGIEVFVAFIIAEILQRQPLYDVLLEREIETSMQGKTVSNKSINIGVEDGSFADGKTVREIFWPVKCYVHTILRDGTEISPGGKTRLMAGDKLHIQSSQYDEETTINELKELVENKKNIDVERENATNEMLVDSNKSDESEYNKE